MTELLHAMSVKYYRPFSRKRRGWTGWLTITLAVCGYVLLIFALMSGGRWQEWLVLGPWAK